MQHSYFENSHTAHVTKQFDEIARPIDFFTLPTGKYSYWNNKLFTKGTVVKTFTEN